MFKTKGLEQKYKLANLKVQRIQQILSRAMVEVRRCSSGQPSPKSSVVKRRSDESSECESIAEVLNNLRKGYLMIKHSPNTSEPHSKFVYLSEDHKFLCWKSPNYNDEKKIEVSSISRVVKEGAEFFIKAGKDIKEIGCCVVVFSTSRTLELEAGTEIEAEIFREELMRAVKYARGMSLNYTYHSI